MTHSLAETAKNYLLCDLSVMPVRDTKRPVGPWESFMDSLMDADDTPRQFASAWGIAVIGGTVSGGLEFIDFDAHGHDIDDIYRAFMSDDRVAFIFSRHKIYSERSPSGGYHLAYTYDCSTRRDGNRKLANWSDGGSMIETRAEGGYCVVYPSPGYTPVSGDMECLPRISEDERNYLIEYARTFDQTVQSDTTNHASNTSDKAVFDNTDPVSWFNWFKASYAKKILEEHGWRKLRHDEKDDVEYWQRPGKDSGDDSWSATWGRKHNSLYVFTSSVQYFTPRAYYTPFQILVRLRFNNDAVAAIQWIVEKYKTTEADYTDLIPVTLAEPPPTSSTIPTTDFPVDVFPLSVRNFISELNNSMNYPMEVTSIAIMFAIATLNGNKIKLRVKDTWVAPTIFWFVSVGDPGTMKSHPISTVIKPIGKLDIESKRIHDEEIARYQQELLDTKGKKFIRKPKFKQILINDITLEAVQDVHAFNKRGLGYYKDELAGFVKAMNQYRKGADEEFWLESFNNANHMVNRKTADTILVENTHINIIGTIQPTVLDKITIDSRDNGFTDRFLYTSSATKSHVLNKNRMDSGWFKWWEQSIRNANQYFQYTDHNDTVILEMDDEAMDAMIEVDERVSKLSDHEDTTPQMKSYLSKRKTYLPRFTLLMSIMDALFCNHDLKITTDHIARADKILTYFIGSAEQVSDDSITTSEMRDVLKLKQVATTKEKVAALASKGFKASDIAKACRISRAAVYKHLEKKQTAEHPA